MWSMYYGYTVIYVFLLQYVHKNRYACSLKHKHVTQMLKSGKQTLWGFQEYIFLESTETFLQLIYGAYFYEIRDKIRLIPLLLFAKS